MRIKKSQNNTVSSTNLVDSNCLACKLWTDCENSSKSVLFCCEQFKPLSSKPNAANALDTILSYGTDRRSEDITDVLNAGKRRSFSGKHLEHDPDDASFNIYDVIEKVIAENSHNTLSDIKIDDSSLPKAPNFYTFATSEKFLGISPYIMQIVIATLTLAEACPVCSDMEWLLHDVEVSDSMLKFEQKVALLESGICPHCRATRSTLVAKHLLNFYQEMAINAGQRSGKSALVAMMAAYLTHRVLKMPKPAETYGLLPNSMLHGTFVALTFAQARDTLWDPYYNYLTSAPWFVDAHNLYAFYGEKYGEDLFKVRDTFVMYRHKNLLTYASAPDKRNLRGRSRIFACLPGNTLINTNSGLVRMDQVHVGDRVTWGNHVGCVTKHQATGNKQLYKLTLASGQQLLASANHKIVVWEPNTQTFVKVRMIDLDTSSLVVYGIGGKFPRELKLQCGEISPSTVDLPDERSKIFGIIDKLKSFDYAVLHAAVAFAGLACVPKYSVVVVSDLVKQGLLQRRYRKGKMFVGMFRTYYQITPKWRLSSVIGERNLGKFSRDKITLPTTMTPALATVLGYLIADGNNIDSGSKGIKFDCMDAQRHSHYNKCFEKCFGIVPKTYAYDYTDKDYKIKGVVYRSTITYAAIINFLRYCGLSADYSSNKTVPWSILQAPKSCVIAFLRAHGECDGGVDYGTIEYRSTSRKLLLQFQQLLLRLGIPSLLRDSGLPLREVSWKYGDKKIHLWNLRIFGYEYTQKFLQEIGFSLHTPTVKATKPRDSSWRIPTHNANFLASRVANVVSTNRTVATYDMTIDHPSHVYQASGVIVGNSCDEIGYFDNTANSQKIKISANEVYIALERSLLTVRASANRLLEKGNPDIPTGYFLNISSPSSYHDKICELVRKSEGSVKTFGLTRATWEMNPTITEDDLIEEFVKDHSAAMRDYGAQPPLSSNPFLSNATLVQEAVGDKRNGIKVAFANERLLDGSYMRYGSAVEVRWCGKPSCVALDAGQAINSFAIASAHINDKGQIVVDLLAEVIPQPKMPLNHSRIYERLIVPILKQQNATFLVADRWNSLKVLADAAASFDRLFTKQISLKHRDFFVIKALLESRQLVLPRLLGDPADILHYEANDYPYCFTNKPADHLYLQFLTVQNSGNKITKGDGNLTDDLFRAVVLCCHVLTLPEYGSLFKEQPEAPPPTQRLLGVSRGNSTGSYSNLYTNGSSVAIGKQRGGDLAPAIANSGVVGTVRSRN